MSWLRRIDWGPAAVALVLGCRDASGWNDPVSSGPAGSEAPGRGVVAPGRGPADAADVAAVNPAAPFAADVAAVANTPRP